MSRVSASGTDNNHQNAIHFEECVDGTTTNANLYIANNYGGSYFNAKNISPAAGVPYILLIQAGVNSVSYGFYTGDGKLKAYKTGRAQRVAAYNIDRVQLGGRLKDGAAPQWSGIGNTSNNMYLGDIGEFMVFDRLLADEEQTAVLDYLKTKWLVANGEPETPAVLAPVSLAPTFGGSTELSLSEGTTFESHVATQPLASFTANGAATLVRNGVTDPGTYAFFNVAGDVTLPLTMALIAESAPPQTATLIGYSGSLNTSDTAWTIQADKAGWRISTIPNRIRFVRDTGLMILVR